MINHNYYQQGNVLRPATNILYVQGETGAKGFPVQSNYTMMLMDAEQPRFYIKSVDAAGMPSMKAYKFEEIVEPAPEKVEYITKADFAAFKEELKEMLASKPIEQPTAALEVKAGETIA